MHISTISVEFGRSRQPQPYETATAKVSFTAVFPEDDASDYVLNAQKLLGQCKTLVLQELNLVAAGQSASVADLKPQGTSTPAAAASTPVVAETAKAETAAQKKAREKKEAADAAAAAKPAADENDIPGEEADKGKHKPVITTASVADIPDGGTPPKAADTTGKLAHHEVHAYIGKLVQEKKIDTASVKAITATFNKPRIADLAEADLPAYVKAVDAKVLELEGI